MPTLNLAPGSVSDYRALAEAKLPRPLFDYIDGGAYEEVTLAANRSDFLDIRLKQRVMRDVSSIDLSTSLFGQSLAMPAALAPIGLGGLMARRGETQAVRAAEAAGVPFCLSTVGLCSLEEVAAAASKPFWFQLYMMRDRGYVKELLQRAKAVGCSALVFTVDLAVVGARYRDARNGMFGGLSAKGNLIKALDIISHFGWVRDVALGGKPLIFGNLAAYVPDARRLTDFRAWVDTQFDPSVTWKDIEWLRTQWDGPLIIKGVLEADDARAAVAAGADGVVVSNHGGRQLDCVASGIAALPAVVEAVGDRCTVLMDGGVRSGQDIVKALAYGAQAVMLGRPWIFALAARGEAGVRQVLDIMKREMNVSLALTGLTSARDVSRDILDL